MTKRMVIMVAIVAVVLGSIFGVKMVKARMMQKYMSFKQPPAEVTALKVTYQPWQPQLKAVGSLRAVRGVDVTSEIAGLVRTVHFDSGQEVKGRTGTGAAQCRRGHCAAARLEAAADLARTTLERDKKQFDVQAVSQATLDTRRPTSRANAPRLHSSRLWSTKRPFARPSPAGSASAPSIPGNISTPGTRSLPCRSSIRSTWIFTAAAGAFADSARPDRVLSRPILPRPHVQRKDNGHQPQGGSGYAELPGRGDDYQSEHVCCRGCMRPSRSGPAPCSAISRCRRPL